MSKMHNPPASRRSIARVFTRVSHLDRSRSPAGRDAPGAVSGAESQVRCERGNGRSIVESVGDKRRSLVGSANAVRPVAGDEQADGSGAAACGVRIRPSPIRTSLRILPTSLPTGTP
jgi:hypothetical protein